MSGDLKLGADNQKLTAEIERLRAMMKRRVTASFGTLEWGEAMDAIGFEVTDELEAAEAAVSGSE